MSSLEENLHKNVPVGYWSTFSLLVMTIATILSSSFFSRGLISRYFIGGILLIVFYGITAYCAFMGKGVRYKRRKVYAPTQLASNGLVNIIVCMIPSLIELLVQEFHPFIFLLFLLSLGTSALGFGVFIKYKK